MKKYGKQLMSDLPDETTRLLTALCTDWVPVGVEPPPLGARGMLATRVHKELEVQVGQNCQSGRIASRAELPVGQNCQSGRIANH